MILRGHSKPLFPQYIKNKIIILLYISHTTTFFRIDIFAPVAATSFAIALALSPRYTHADTYYLSLLKQN